MFDRDTDKRNVFAQFMSAGSVEKAFVLGDVRNDFGNSGVCDAAGDSFAEAVVSALFFPFIESLVGFDPEFIAVAERKGTTKHPEFTIQDVENGFQKGTDIPFGKNSLSDFSNDCE